MPFAKLKKRWNFEREQRKTRSKKIKRLLLEQGKTVFERFGVSKVIIFGSVADNLCGGKSDLDILAIPLPNDKYWEFRLVEAKWKSRLPGSKRCGNPAIGAQLNFVEPFSRGQKTN